MESLTEKLATIIVASVFIVIGLIFMVTPFIAGFPLVLVGLYMFKKALWGKSTPLGQRQSSKAGQPDESKSSGRMSDSQTGGVQ